MPRKTFSAGDVLTAADVNLFLSNEVTLTSSTATAYTVLTTDRYKTLMFTDATAVTVTFGTATAFEPGERVDILQDGAGTVTINTDGTDTTLSGRGTAGTAYTIGQQYDAVSVVCVDTNSYRIIGNATAV
jgi:L-ascorbate metabolism protein UlaG (beta-lactamase superfamily)